MNKIGRYPIKIKVVKRTSSWFREVVLGSIGRDRTRCKIAVSRLLVEQKL